MSSILEKIGSYQILTNLLPGAFFGLALKFFFGLAIPTKNIGEDILFYYFFGLIINRIGSLIVEPALKTIRYIKHAPYSDFVNAVRIDSKIDILSEMNNYIRSVLTCVLLLPVVRILQVVSLRWVWLSENWIWITIMLLLILFLFSYKKQVDYIRKRVEAVNSREEKGNEMKTKIDKK